MMTLRSGVSVGHVKQRHYHTRLERFARDKHSSLVWKSLNYAKKVLFNRHLVSDPLLGKVEPRQPILLPARRAAAAGLPPILNWQFLERKGIHLAPVVEHMTRKPKVWGSDPAACTGGENLGSIS